MDKTNESFVSATCEFSGLQYNIDLLIEDKSLLSIELLRLESSEEWKTEMTSQYVEEVTRKTGSFKRFTTFCSMLRSAVTQQMQQALSLDLLSYSDLEKLQSMRDNLGNHLNRQPVADSKRYLILTYMTEFDTVRYPIPLSYVGRQSNNQLRSVIRSLRQELSTLKMGKLLSESPAENHKLRNTIGNLRTQNELLVQELFSLRKQLDNQAAVVSGHGDQCATGLSSELRTFVNNLETELLEERSKCSRIASQYRREVAQLKTALDMSLATQRNLQRRFNQVTADMSMFKRGSRINGSPIRAQLPSASGGRCTCRHSQSSGVDSLETAVDCGYRGRPPTRHISCQALCKRPNSCQSRVPRRPSSSSPLFRRTVTASPSSLRTNLTSNSLPPYPVGRPRTTSLDSIVGNRQATYRFDPTAYVRDKERQRQETLARCQRIRRAQLSSTDHGIPKHLPHSSVGTLSPCGHKRQQSTSAPPVHPELLAVGRFSPQQRLSTGPSPANPLFSSSSCESLARIAHTTRTVRCNDVRGSKVSRPFDTDDSDNCSTTSQPGFQLNLRRMRLHNLSHRSSSDDNEISCADQKIGNTSHLQQIRKPPNRLGWKANRKLVTESDAFSFDGSPSVRRGRTNKRLSELIGHRQPPEPSDELEEIDRRLDVLQNFFAKYTKN